MSGTNVVFTSSNHMEAELVKGLLESHGLEVFLLDGNLSRINPLFANVIGGVKIAVPDKQIEAARKVLEEYLGKDGTGSNSGRISPFG